MVAQVMARHRDPNQASGQGNCGRKSALEGGQGAQRALFRDSGQG